jgi:hypothetical protein
MASPVTLTTLQTRVQQRCNFEGATGFVSLAEITDCLNGSIATEVYDLIRADVSDEYYRKTVTFLTTSGTNVYTLAGIGATDFLTLRSVDAFLGANISATAPKLNCRRYLDEERNLYVSLPLGWAYGQWILYSLTGQSITFQPIPDSAYAIGINYVPVPTALVNPGDTFDDINGWSEIAVLDAASKCLAKAKQFEAAQYYDARRIAMKQEIRALISLRNSEPERTHAFGRQQWGDGWEFGGGWG